MTRDEFIEIMDDDEISGSLLFGLEGDNALIGLNIIAKYSPKKVIVGAEHDIIYCGDIGSLIGFGITKEDVEYLSKINWHIEEGEYLACFV